MGPRHECTKLRRGLWGRWVTALYALYEYDTLALAQGAWVEGVRTTAYSLQLLHR